MNIPTSYRLTFTPAQVTAAIERVAPLLTGWAAEVRQSTGNDVIAVSVLRGGIFLFAELVRRINAPLQMAWAEVEAYRLETQGEPLEELRVKLRECDYASRAVLLVDDICDSGRTLAVLSDELLARGAAVVASVVLVNRGKPEGGFRPGWSCFEYAGPEWFVGFGMDDGDRWANLPGVYTVTPSIPK